ncbi:MAG: thiamine-phosphate kinase [Proteobacteria bacterium]|nr:thiamine-phosphate kinase [Pseudomonadota bacterium]
MTIEFDLINHITQRLGPNNKSVLLGIGDDAAVLQTSKDQQLLVSTDTLIEHTHFKATDEAYGIGYKSLAVNLSDMAAMCAIPKWVCLNLSLPRIDMEWINGFLDGFISLLDRFHVNLVGGDTTCGSLSITVTVLGEAPLKQIKRRDSAKAGQLIAVSGSLGSAAFALANPGADDECTKQLHLPNPRLDLSSKLDKVAVAMIDISDGLLADLGHICKASGTGAIITTAFLPIAKVVKSSQHWLDYALSGGDDYQLCFTLDAQNLKQLPSDCSIIGEITTSSGIKIMHEEKELSIINTGYQHFKNE